MRSSAIGLSILLLLGAAVYIAARESGPAPYAARAGPDSPVVDDSEIWYRGVALQMRTGFGPIETYSPLIREIAELGADTVLLSSAGFMEHARAQGILIDVRKAPSPDDFTEIIRQAKQLGLKVIVMPILLLSYPRGSEWRGVIEPPDWNDWFRQYRKFVVHFADIARAGGADALMIGSELVSTEKYTAQWVKTIEITRQHFPGKLGYSANWDHYQPIQFWDKLDFIGMTSYYKLADRKGAGVDQMISKWEPIRKRILRWRRKIGKPLVLTEVGWCSQLGAATAPWNYYQNQKPTPQGHEEQRRLYEAFLRVWDGSQGLAGVIWWEWTGSAGGPSDFGYTPKNKPAEKLLREWFAKGRSSTAVGTPATQP